VELLFVAWVVAVVVFAPLAAFKAKRMGQPFWPWLLAGIALPIVTLAIVSYYEPRSRREQR
jgi:hypothetical protein